MRHTTDAEMRVKISSALIIYYRGGNTCMVNVKRGVCTKHKRRCKCLGCPLFRLENNAGKSLKTTSLILT